MGLAMRRASSSSSLGRTGGGGSTAASASFSAAAAALMSACSAPCYNARSEYGLSGAGPPLCTGTFTSFAQAYFLSGEHACLRGVGLLLRARASVALLRACFGAHCGHSCVPHGSARRLPAVHLRLGSSHDVYRTLQYRSCDVA